MINSAYHGESLTKYMFIAIIFSHITQKKQYSSEWCGGIISQPYNSGCPLLFCPANSLTHKFILVATSLNTRLTLVGWETSSPLVDLGPFFWWGGEFLWGVENFKNYRWIGRHLFILWRSVKHHHNIIVTDNNRLDDTKWKVTAVKLFKSEKVHLVLWNIKIIQNKYDITNNIY